MLSPLAIGNFYNNFKLMTNSLMRLSLSPGRVVATTPKVYHSMIFLASFFFFLNASQRSRTLSHAREAGRKGERVGGAGGRAGGDQVTTQHTQNRDTGSLSVSLSRVRARSLF